MTTTQPGRPIRPSPEELRAMPTLELMTPDQGTEDLRDCAMELGVDFRLELKLETPDERYWLCTQGATVPDQGVPEQWIVGNVSIELLRGAGRAEMVAYSPENYREMQQLDYGNIIRKELDQLYAAQELNPSDQAEDRIEELREEFRAVFEEEFRGIDEDT